MDLYRSIFEFSSDAFLVVDNNGRINTLNARAAELFGYDREALVGQPVERLIPARFGDRHVGLRSAYASVPRVRRQMAAGLELFARRQDGSEFPVDVLLSPIESREGKSLLCVVHDLTERKQSALRLSELAELKETQRIAGVGSWSWDIVTGVVRWSEQLYRHVGMDPSLRPVPYPEQGKFYTQESWNRLRAAVEEAITKGTPYELDLEMKLPAPLPRWITARGEPVYEAPTGLAGGGDGRRRITGLRGTAHDITERKATEAALRRSEERLRQAIEASRVCIFEYDYRTGAGDWVPCAPSSLGLGPETPVSASYPDRVHPRDRERVAAAIRHGSDPAGEGLVNVEHRVALPDGSIRWVEVRSQTFFENGENALRASRTVGTIRDITEAQQAAEELKKLAVLVDRSHDPIAITTLEGQVVYLNEAGRSLVGMTREEALERSLFDFFSDSDQEVARKSMYSILLQGGYWSGAARMRNFKTGNLTDVEITAFPIQDEDGAPLYIATITRDLTDRNRAEEERRKLEAQLFQSQKMESIGRLAGGVAHDFNNMLTVILGYATMLKDSFAANSVGFKQLTEIENAANRSKDLTQQLLGYSQRQMIAPVPTDLNELIADLEEPLSRLIGEDVELAVEPFEDLWKVVLDPSQVNQILLNLVVNARDAMPGGGKLTIGTGNVTVSEEFCAEHPIAKAGPHVVLSVCDTGTGMDEETLGHIFEPFFSTKGPGKGTGLGLATVYGIVTQNHGFIEVHSEAGKGATFRIYFPPIIWEKAAEPPEEPRSEEPGHGTILLVEDDDLVRTVTAEALSNSGYSLLVAAGPKEAIEICSRPEPKICLLLTDVVMPEMNGMQLSKRILALRPGIRVLFMSGYTANVIVSHGMLKHGVHFIQKPFGIQELRRQIEETLKSEHTSRTRDT